MNSCIYQGTVRHRRYNPIGHEFQYSLYMLYLDLDELEMLFRKFRGLLSSGPLAPLWLKRADHLGDPQLPLDHSVRELIQNTTGRIFDGSIRLLTHPRTWWMGFNPVSFYYCFDGDSQLNTLVAEVNNTPWLEQHPYVLTESDNLGTGRTRHYQFRKDFHVSPFMSLDYAYDWRFSQPGRTLSIHMQNLHEGILDFDATMTLEQRPLTHAQLMRVLITFPFMTAKVVGGIYWQALRLRLKGAQYYDHPKNVSSITKAG